MAAPTFVAEYPTAFDSTTSPKTAMNAVSIGAGDVLVAVAADEGYNGTGISVSENGGGSWSALQGLQTGNYCQTRAWGYVAPSAETLTAQYSDNAAAYFGGNILRFSGSDGIGASNIAQAASGTPTVSLTTTQANSAIVIICADYNAVSGTQTFALSGASPTDLTDFQGDAVHYGIGIAYFADAGAEGAKSITMTAPTGQKWTMIAVEVKGTAAAAGQSAGPTSDVSDGDWTPSTGTDLYAVLDETIESDADYASVNSNSAMRVALGSLSTPEAGTRTLSYRVVGPAHKKIIARLIEGSTTVQTWTDDPAPATLTTKAQTVTGTVTDYSNLRVELETADATSPPTTAVTWGAIGTGANGSTSATPTYPTGISAATSKLYCIVASGASGEPTPTMPSGWTNIGSFSGGSGATFGIDVGNRRTTYFRKDTVDGTETGTVTVSLSSGNTMRAHIVRLEVPAGYTISEAFASGADTTAGTAVSVTTSSGLSWADGDLLLVNMVSSTDTATQSSVGISASGVTFGTLTNRASTAVTTGNDLRYILDSVPVTTGSGTSAPTYSYTASASTSGPAGFLRLRAAPPTEFGRVSWIRLEIPAAAASGSVALSGLSTTYASGNIGADRPVPVSGSYSTWSAGTPVAARLAALAGAANTATAGTISAVRAVPLTGQSATWSAGTLAALRSAGLSGSQIQALAGTLTPEQVSAIEVALTGQAASATAGSLAASRSAALNGSAASVVSGVVTGVRQAGLSGSASTWSTGTLTALRAAGLSGQQAQTLAGSLTAEQVAAIEVALSGSSATVSSGALSAIRNIVLSGQAANAVAGTPTPDRRADLSGDFRDIFMVSDGEGGYEEFWVADGAGGYEPFYVTEFGGIRTLSGSLTPAQTAAIQAALSGSSMTWTAGTMTALRSAGLTGLQVLALVGSLQALHQPSVSGQAATVAVGTTVAARSAAISGSATTWTPGSLLALRVLGLTGQQIQALSGSLTTDSTVPVVASLTGLSVSTAAGTVGPVRAISLPGVVLATSVGTPVASRSAGISGSAYAWSSGTLDALRQIALAGHEAQAVAGALLAARDVPMAGQAIPTALGTLTPMGSVAYLGSLTARISLTPSLSADADLYAAVSADVTVYFALDGNPRIA